MGILYLVGGFLILTNPMIGAITLTFALGTFYFLLSLSRIFIAYTQPLPGWGWLFANGIVSILLGSFIWFYWPITSLWVIGILVGIDIISIGWWFAMLGWSAKKKTALLTA